MIRFVGRGGAAVGQRGLRAPFRLEYASIGGGVKLLIRRRGWQRGARDELIEHVLYLRAVGDALQWREFSLTCKA